MYKPIIAITLALSLLCPAKSSSMDFTVSNENLIMSGKVVNTDCNELSGYIRAKKIKKIILTKSNGGHADSGYCVGEIIRNAGLDTAIQGKCSSACSRMWLGGVHRELIGPESKVGLHGNYDNAGNLRPEAPWRLKNWLPVYAPAINLNLMEKWINLPRNNNMMYFYNNKAELCIASECEIIKGMDVKKAGLLSH